DLAKKIADATGFEGQIIQDASKPDGTPVKCTNISRIRSTGWQPTISLDDGLTQTVADYRQRVQSGEVRSI
ncbi:MAG: GDP-L-fucose synthase, partial [Rhodopirellula bahusiensis]